MSAAQERATKLAAAKSADELAQRLVEMADDSDNYTDDADLRAAADLLRAAHDVAAVKHAVWVHLAAVFSAGPDGRGDRTFYSTDTGSSLTSGELAARIARDVCALSLAGETTSAQSDEPWLPMSLERAIERLDGTTAMDTIGQHRHAVITLQNFARHALATRAAAGGAS